jgi:hypothetical protein
VIYLAVRTFHMRPVRYSLSRLCLRVKELPQPGTSQWKRASISRRRTLAATARGVATLCLITSLVSSCACPSRLIVWGGVDSRDPPGESRCERDDRARAEPADGVGLTEARLLRRRADPDPVARYGCDPYAGSVWGIEGER